MFLRAVAVVDVPVDDQDLADLVLCLGIAGGDGGIVEDAEAHAFVGGGVMTRRSVDAECVFGLAAKDGINCETGSACRVQGRAQGFRADDRVARRQAVATGGNVSFRNRDVIGNVTSDEVGILCRARLEVEEPFGVVGLFDFAHDGVEPGDAFRVASAGVVLFGDFVGN